ncbi:MAG TPA: chemotaxis protein CheW [Pirellulales bacterium]|jgi:purine-binding chemotaxis protein CheW|nr:chemotaxis protein CheW [Pirellulales bacterium]
MGVAETERNTRGESDARSRAAEKVIIFHLADQAYAIPLDAVLEILPMARLAHPPGLPAVLAGFLNLGGTAVPVVKLARLFGLAEQAPGLYTPLLVVRLDGQTLALLVDAVDGIAPIDESTTLTLRENLCFNDCAESLATVGDTNVILLSNQRLFHEQEQRRIGELVAIEQSRLASFQEEQS